MEMVYNDSWQKYSTDKSCSSNSGQTSACKSILKSVNYHKRL